MNDNTVLITETNEVEHTASGRRKRSRERMRKQQTTKLSTTYNEESTVVPKQIPCVQVRQYILEKKGIDNGHNFNSGSLMLCILVILVGVVRVFGKQCFLNSFLKID